jgi:hypothetical protein
MTIAIDYDFLFSLNQKVDQMHKHMKKGREPQPIRKPVGGAITLPTGFSGTGPVLLTTELAPAKGQIWNVLKIGIFGPDPHTAVASVNADVFLGTNPDPSAPAFLDVTESGLAIPTISRYAKEVEWCYPGQQPFAMLYGTGLAAGQNYELVLRVAEYKASEEEQMWI